MCFNMNYRIDNLQYCKWSRDIFKINRDAGLNAVHATVVYHEDYDEFLIKLKEWDNLFNENSDLIFLGKTFEDIWPPFWPPFYKKRPRRLDEASVQVQYGTPGGTRTPDPLVRSQML